MSADTRPVDPATPQPNPSARRAGIFMMIGFGIACLLFVCGGAVAVGALAANGSESDGILASYFAVGPASFALFGMLTSIITHFAVKQNVWAKVLIPLLVAFLGAACAGGCPFVFYEAIWPSL